MTEVIQAATAEHFAGVRSLWTSYWNELGFTPCFQGFDRELVELPGKYAPPSGCLLIAMIDGVAGGAVAFRRLESDACEAKRLYVAADYRGQGIARLLMDRLIEAARAAGYRRIAGDTMPVMVTALAMYDRMGFRRIGPYPGSTPGAICVEFTL